MAVVEAKRKRKEVSQALVQAERYSRGWKSSGDVVTPAGGPWGPEKLQIPFLFATNGRPYLQQIAEKSGIWFRDARREENHGRPLEGWYSPEGLVALLKQDIPAANEKLAREPTDYLGLRDYQVRAIRTVEEGLAASDRAAKAADKKQTFLVAMATGTGKTRTAIGLVYRLLKTKRFRRVLFLVDRTALGEQTANAFKDARLENLQTFADIFDLKELKDVAPDPVTKLQIATVQGMVKRILFPSDPADTPPVDQYDCVVVDECHRGYGFDRELSDSELGFRDLDLPGKTLVFAATDLHADTLVRLLKEAFEARHGSLADNAVLKITGASDQPLKLIRRFKNETWPNVAVTVDLLSTGIDVPRICNIVFLRRVRSRILYEQMMGRATRLCPDIDKAFFRIFDAVDLYAALEDYTEMLPVAAAPSFTFAKLVAELGAVTEDDHRQTVLEQLLAKLQRRRHTLKGEALSRFEGIASMSPKELVAMLKEGTPAQATSWFRDHQYVVAALDEGGGGAEPLLVSEHVDEHVSTEHGYGKDKKPDDYLAGFTAFVRENMNRLPALVVVTQRPRELTRKQLKEVELALAEAGYTEGHLRAAWHDKTNAEIAASILGFIRQAALGDALVDHEERVDRGLKKILARQAWTPVQRDWLVRIAKQIKRERLVDREAIDSGAFAAQSGFRHLDKTFDGKLAEVLGDLGDAMWKDAG